MTDLGVTALLAAPFGLKLSASTDSGVLGDGRTNASSLTIEGASTGGTVKLAYTASNGARGVLDAIMGDGGNWWVNTGFLAAGTYAFKAFAETVGIKSTTSSTFKVVIDQTTTAPVIKMSTITRSTTPVVWGTAEKGSVVSIYVDGSPVAIGTAVANSHGKWSFKAPALAEGQHTFKTIAADVAGNVSEPSVAVVTIDITRPLSPVILSAVATTTGGPAVTGTAEANALVYIYQNGINTAPIIVKAGADGAWSYTFSEALSSAVTSLAFRARDAAGNVSYAVSTKTSAILPATEASTPTAPVDSSAGLKFLDAPSITDFTSAITNVVKPVIKGMAAAGATVSVYVDGTSTLLGKAVADATGAWSLTSPVTIADGKHSFVARATDKSGTLSGFSGSQTLTIDHIAPIAPTVAAFASSLTSDNTPTLSGKAEIGAVVTVYDGATAVGKAVADASGAWTLTTGAIGDGLHSFTAKAVDAAGNVSAASYARSMTIDTQAPVTKVTGLVLAGDNVIDNYEAVATKIHVTGTLSQSLATGDSLVLLVDGVKHTVAAASIAGTTFALDIAKPAAGWSSGSFSAYLEDAVHNTGAGFTGTYTVNAVLPPSSGSGFLLGINISGGEYGSGGNYGWSYIYPSAKQIDYYSGKGLDVIRMPFDWERVQKTPYADLDAVELARIDAVVNYATAKGLQIVLDPHGYGYGFGGLIGSAATPNSMFSDFWGKLADHYKGNQNVVFGLMNEPHDQTATSWLGTVNEALAAIRATGATNEVLIPGTYWDGAWKWTSNDNSKVLAPGIVDPGHNYTFEVHQYLDTWSSGTSATIVSEDIGWQRLVSITDWATQTGNKLFLGEFGVAQDAASLRALDKMISYMEQHSDVWQGATYWAGGAWSANYMYSAEPIAGVDKPQMLVLQQHANQVV